MFNSSIIRMPAKIYSTDVQFLSSLSMTRSIVIFYGIATYMILNIQINFRIGQREKF